MRKKNSAILEAVCEMAKGLFDAGVMDQVTLREFDRLCLPPVETLKRWVEERNPAMTFTTSPTLGLSTQPTAFSRSYEHEMSRVRWC